MDERNQAVEARVKAHLRPPEDGCRRVEDRLCTLHAKTLQLIAETEPDCGREDIVSGPLRFLSRSLWTEISDLHRGLDAHLRDPCLCSPKKVWTSEFANGPPGLLLFGSPARARLGLACPRRRYQDLS